MIPSASSLASKNQFLSEQFLDARNDLSPATEIEDPPVRCRSPNRFAAFYRATVGKKVVMAVSGLVLLVFVVGHLAGNLQIFLGAERAERLRGIAPTHA